MKYESELIKTSRIETSVIRMGTPGKPRLLFVHGNLSSSVFYLPLMQELAPHFEMVAVDLRGFGNTEALPIDATLGLNVWSDDLDALRVALEWDTFSLAGWSMGGGVAMQYAITYSKHVEKLVLFAPLSPFGFGGTYTNDGKMLEPINIASGGGCVNPDLIKAVCEQDKDYLRNILRTLYFKPTYTIDAEYEDIFVDSLASAKYGDGLYPGDFEPATQWPNVSAGTKGVCNTMAPGYCNLATFADIPTPPPVLWFQGDSDLIVSDTSVCDFGYLGQIGAVPGWPGIEAFPPQPMVSQMRYVLDKAGNYKEVVVEDAGHACFLEQQACCVKEILAFFDC